MLEVEGASKRYGAVVALGGVNLRAGEGEFVTLLGPSGCGKSTLLGVIAGTIEPDAGEVRVAGARLDLLPAEKRNLGMVFQSYALFPHMRVRDNVAFGLRMRRVPNSELERRVRGALELVGLEAMASRYPRALSGGQQQRVALARAVVIEPSLLLLDEPLSNLDARLREGLRDELRALQRRVGTTSVYVTHDQAEAMALSDRIVVMRAGRVVEEGTPVELYRAPRHRFTAEFLGNTNLIPAIAEPGALRLPWSEAVPNPRDLRGPVLLSVRPEDVRLEARPDGRGEVEGATFLGDRVEFLVRLGTHLIRAQQSGSAVGLLALGARVEPHLPNDPHAVLDDDLEPRADGENPVPSPASPVVA